MRNWHWKGVDSYFCAWSYWICICRSFPFRHKRYWSAFKIIIKRVLLMFAIVKLLVFAPLLNTPKKHVLNNFALEMAAITVSRRRHCRELRACGRRERFFPHVLIYFECQKNTIIWAYHLPSHVIFNLVQEIKDNFEPSTRSHAIPCLSKLINLHFLASDSFQHTVASLFFICDYAHLRYAWCIALVNM